MTKIFITGSADGLGRMAAQLLIGQGHDVILHGRNEARAKNGLKAVAGAHTALSGDLSSIKETVNLAGEVNKLGHFDAVIHNAAIGYREPRRIATTDGLPEVFAVNSLEEGPKTQVWLAVSNDPGARVTGKYFYHMRQSPFNPLAKDEQIQEKFLRECEKLSGIAFPA